MCSLLWSNFDKQAGVWSKSYDIIIIFVSFVDFITDIIVAYHFYQQNYTQFYFCQSISLIATHLSYSFSVSYNVTQSCGYSFWTQSVLLLPISPLLPIITFIGSNNSNSTLHKKLIKWKLCPQESWTDYCSINCCFLDKWIWQKHYRHFEYLLQASFESAPSLIVQLIALLIFYSSQTNNYNYSNISLITSIFCSFLSIIIKYPLFPSPIATLLTTDISTFLLCWLSASLDFMNVVWYFCWLSCIINQLYSFHFPFIDIYLQFLVLKLCICVVPYSFMVTLRKMLFKSTKCMEFDIESTKCSFSAFLLLFCSIPHCIQWVLLSICCAMLYEIKNFTYLPKMIASVTRLKIKSSVSNNSHSNSNYEFRRSVLKFIQYGEGSEVGTVNTSFCKPLFVSNETKLIRILAVNYCLLTEPYINFVAENYPILNSYLQNLINSSVLVQYNESNHIISNHKRLRYSTLRKNTLNTEKSDLFCQIKLLYQCNLCELPKQFAKRFKKASFVFCIVLKYIVFPLYVLSRFITIFVPFVLAYYGCLYFEYIPLFQICWIFMQCVTTIMLFVFGIHSMRLHYYWWHVIPGFEKNVISKPMIMRLATLETIMSRLWFYHDELKYKCKREQIVVNRFGKTIGQLILEFVGHFRLINQAVSSDETFTLNVDT